MSMQVRQSTPYLVVDKPAWLPCFALHCDQHSGAYMERNVSKSLEQRVGWSIPAYCEAVGYSRAMFYLLPSELRPRSVKVGRRHIVIEPPAKYLARLAAAQELARAEAPA
jgi:hypothetical protein